MPEQIARLRTRNERVLTWAAGAYVAILILLAIPDGVELSASFILAGIGIGAVLVALRWMPLRDWVPILVVSLAYELVRGYGALVAANVHVTDWIALERLVSAGQMPTAVLQSWLHPRAGFDVIAAASTILYLLHVPLPLMVGLLLWKANRRAFFDFVAALTVLSLAAFATYLLVPVSPPWWAAAHGFMPGPNGEPLISYLKPAAFSTLADAAGLPGRFLGNLAFNDISPDSLAAFPSLHAAYPFLAFLYSWRLWRRARWVALAYTLAAWFGIVYLGDHYIVDIVGGAIYAVAAYALVERLEPETVAASGAVPAYNERDRVMTA